MPRKLAAELDSLPLTREPTGRTPDAAVRVRQLEQHIQLRLKDYLAKEIGVEVMKP